jgi:LL-diaminopimelate aminotransferase
MIGAKRLNKLPPYPFKVLQDLKKEYKGSPLLDFGEGNPDLMPPKEIIDCLKKSLLKPESHRYPNYEGLASCREAVAKWYQRRFGVLLNPEKEVAMLIGSKEGIAHLFWAVSGPGDTVAISDPCFPIYRNCPLLSGARLKILPLREENGFLPEITRLKNSKIKLLCLNYPNNPTGAVAEKDFFQEVISLAQKQGFLVFNDNVYSEIYFHTPPPSILQIPGSKEVAIEFHSLSKTFNLPGWRIGFVVGNEEIISALLRIKQNIDTGPFNAIQEAAICALNRTEFYGERMRRVYLRRRNLFISGLTSCGWEVNPPKATFYLWIKVPDKSPSLSFSIGLLKRFGILCAPGVAFGKYGEGYLRFSLTVKEKEIREAVRRLRTQWSS